MGSRTTQISPYPYPTAIHEHPSIILLVTRDRSVSKNLSYPKMIGHTYSTCSRSRLAASAIVSQTDSETTDDTRLSNTRLSENHNNGDNSEVARTHCRATSPSHDMGTGGDSETPLAASSRSLRRSERRISKKDTLHHTDTTIFPGDSLNIIRYKYRLQAHRAKYSLCNENGRESHTPRSEMPEEELSRLLSTSRRRGRRRTVDATIYATDTAAEILYKKKICRDREYYTRNRKKILEALAAVTAAKRSTRPRSRYERPKYDTTISAGDPAFTVKYKYYRQAERSRRARAKGWSLPKTPSSTLPPADLERLLKRNRLRNLTVDPTDTPAEASYKIRILSLRAYKDRRKQREQKSVGIETTCGSAVTGSEPKSANQSVDPFGAWVAAGDTDHMFPYQLDHRGSPLMCETDIHALLTFVDGDEAQHEAEEMMCGEVPQLMPVADGSMPLPWQPGSPFDDQVCPNESRGDGSMGYDQAEAGLQWPWLAGVTLTEYGSSWNPATTEMGSVLDTAADSRGEEWLST